MQTSRTTWKKDLIPLVMFQIRLMKDELGGTIMIEFMSLKPKLYSYKKVDGSQTLNGPHFVEDKKCKGNASLRKP